MFFVHPQIKLSNLVKAKLALIKPSQTDKLIRRLSSYFPHKQFIFTDMARVALRVIIEKLNLQGSEMILPAYICDIFTPILKHYNIRPVFLDIDQQTFGLKAEEISRKINPRTKAILVSHTYGLPVDTRKIREASGNRLVIIEDCAHSFGAMTGRAGDVSFFSLYKQFPTLRGGLLVCPKDWQVDLPVTSFNLRDFISFLNCFSIFALFFKKFGGKVAPQMVRKEKLSRPAGINRVSLNLFSDFLDDFENSLEGRKKLAIVFQKELKKLGFNVQEATNNVFCYLSALVPKGLDGKRDEIIQKLRKYGVFCTRIWHTPIILSREAQREYHINPSDYPNTVEAAKRVINFPLQNYYREQDIKKMVEVIKKVLKEL